MSVAVLVPYRADRGHRDTAWRWVRNRWREDHPDWPVVVGSCPDGPWRKGAAVADALTRLTAEIVVVADADVCCGGVTDAVDMVRAGAPWAIPHGRVHRLSQAATARVLAGSDPAHEATVVDGLARTPYLGIEGGGMVVLPADALRRVPIDPRFAGWGSEDEAFGRALSTVVGRRWRGTTDLFHLWHEPALRLNAHVGNAASHALNVRYQCATGDRAAMRALLAEINP